MSLSATQKEEIKEKILSKISEVERDLEDLKESTKPIPPENAIGRISRMDAINNRSVNLEAFRQSKSTHTLLKKALIEIEKEDFGYCKNCNEQIQFPRLLFRPQSLRCVKCARR